MHHPHGLPADLNVLVALDTLLAVRSVTIAAKRLGVTQSAMSRTLKRLREMFGDRLFVSAKGGLAPTARATELAGPLRHALVGLGAAVSMGAPFDPKSSTKTFVLATADYGELIAVPRLLASVRAEAPRVKIHVRRIGPDVADLLEAGAVDLVAGLPLGPVASFRRTALTVERFVVLSRKGNRSERALTLDRYLACPHLVIAPAGSAGGVVDDWLAREGLSRNVVLRVSQFASAPFVAASSDLLLTAPEGLAVWARPFVSLQEHELPLPVGPSRSFATWHDRVHDDPSHRWFRAHVIRAASARSA